MLCYLFSELSRKMVQELSLMTFHWNILKGPQLTFRKNWFARHSKYHSIPRPRKAVPVVHHLHLNSDKWETCFIIGFHGTGNSLTPRVMAISRITVYPLLILFWGSHDTNLKVAIITCWTFISKMIIWMSLCNRTAKEEDTKTFVCDKCDQAIT